MSRFCSQTKPAPTLLVGAGVVRDWWIPILDETAARVEAFEKKTKKRKSGAGYFFARVVFFPERKLPVFQNVGGFIFLTKYSDDDH